MESLAHNTEVVQYHTWKNKKVFGTNNIDGTSQKGKYKRLPVNSPHNFHTHFSSHYEQKPFWIHLACLAF
jgi:hypothetical protein